MKPDVARVLRNGVLIAELEILSEDENGATMKLNGLLSLSDGDIIEMVRSGE